MASQPLQSCEKISYANSFFFVSFPVYVGNIYVLYIYVCIYIYIYIHTYIHWYNIYLCVFIIPMSLSIYLHLLAMFVWKILDNALINLINTLFECFHKTLKISTINRLTDYCKTAPGSSNIFLLM